MRSECAQTLRDWLLPQVPEPTYTAWDLEAFAEDCGWDRPAVPLGRGAPLPAALRARCRLLSPLPAGRGNGDWRPAGGEMAADLARLKASFPIPRDAVDYIMDTFPIVKRKDIEKHGEYRTKLVILDIYDRMLHVIATGEPYQTLLDPPPADARCCHPPRQAVTE